MVERIKSVENQERDDLKVWRRPVICELKLQQTMAGIFCNPEENPLDLEVDPGIVGTTEGCIG